MEEQLTPQETSALEQAGYGYGFPQQEEQHNLFSFFKRVLSMEDTTKTANLTEVELGAIRIPVRTLLKLALYCKQMGLKGLGEHFAKEAHVITDSSLGREGFLDKLVVTQKREMEASTRESQLQTPAQKENWFKKSRKKKNPAAPDYP